jgi:hypothetical protein
VERKLAYRHQTRLRGLDEPQTELAVINEEEDSDTDASGSWAAPIPRYDNHEVEPRIDVWTEEEAMASLATERNNRKLFNGDKEGPPLRHLKQMHAAQDVGIKLRPTAVSLTPNDRFILLTDLLEGGARSQADQLQERMQRELDVHNVMELAEYEESVAMHPLRVAEWNALPAARRGPAPVPPAPAPLVVNTLFRVSYGSCLTVCILNGPPVALKSTGTLNLARGVNTQYGESFRPASHANRGPRVTSSH